MEQEKLIEAVEQIRRDKHQPWRYILFTFLNGIAQGLGMALGMTVILGIVLFILMKLLASMVNVPVVGEYIDAVMKLMQSSVRHGPRVR
jgi:hypothetical protein